MSHDLRTPLTAITRVRRVAGRRCGPAGGGAAGRCRLLGEARRLDRLVADLLDLARLGAQDFRVELAPVDLLELGRAPPRSGLPAARAAGVEFRLEAPGPAVVGTDAARVRQILDGLLENALRVTPAGRPIVLARAPRTAPGAGCVLEVRDGGPGLTDDDLAVAFDRSALYDRYRGVRQVGTGLGLAIVHGLVTRLGGTVQAGHAAEGGARFTVRLPAAGSR